MSNRINKISLALLVSLLGATAAWASDVYIDQAGSTTTIDITQSGSGNTIGSSGTASTIIGDNSNIDLVQTGSNNAADIETATGASGTIINYSATGGSNVLDVDISAASDTTLTTAITGDSNEVTLCGTIATNAGAAVSATCGTEVSANTTTTNLAITGDSNKVAVGADAAGAVNNITLGANTVSDFNVINLSQGGTDTPVVTVNVDGSTNAVNITQN
jgi:hypothetical protein|tara:strand:+ start:1638 stop:2291 length:654 start_codon:yes stop_codon:yes gene_type:complete